MGENTAGTLFILLFLAILYFFRKKGDRTLSWTYCIFVALVLTVIGILFFGGLIDFFIFG